MKGVFNVDLSGPRPTVSLDGIELPAASVYLKQEAGSFPQVHVIMDASHATVTGSGDVSVAAPQAGILDFLNRVNVEKLEAEAMEAGFDKTIAANVIDVLKRWASPE